MQHLDDWPTPLLTHLRATHGRPTTIERLGGMSVARVYRVGFAHGPVVLKVSPRPAERLFYERIAAGLRASGVPIPGMEWSAHLAGRHWLVLEHLPRSIQWPPAGAWRPDPRIIAVLADLHRTTRGWPSDIHPAPPSAWTRAVTCSALRCFPAAVLPEVEPLLAMIQRDAAGLTGAWCWISGDPSPPNWAARADGSPVLFDWELFRPGVPAADLAPTVPGLPEPTQFRMAAEAYIDAWRQVGGPLPWSVNELSRDIAVAKAATFVMLLAAHAEKRARIPENLIAWLVAGVPAWLQRNGWRVD